MNKIGKCFSPKEVNIRLFHADGEGMTTHARAIVSSAAVCPPPLFNVGALAPVARVEAGGVYDGFESNSYPEMF